MSKRRQRMENFGEAEKRKLRRPPETWSMKDKLVVCGVFATAMLAFTLPPFISMTMRYRNTIDRRLAKWKIEYGLSDSEIASLRKTERSFHYINPLTTPKPLTSQQMEEHNRQLAREMNSKSARKFMEHQKSGERPH